ncbi:helicase [Callinectes sapidus nudivirus]|nr:helicase [Callinectes sapidus nudivirus]
MAKRNWDEVSEELAITLDINERVNTNNAEDDNFEQKTKRLCCYDIQKTNIVYKTTNNFIHEKFLKKSRIEKGPKKSYYIKNQLTKKSIRINKDESLTIGELENKFKDIGHCLAYKIADTYSTKLMLDFDCYKCKINNCNNLIESELIKIIHDDVCDFVKDTLKTENVNCVIFKKSNTCNLHIYFNVSVSLPLLELMRKRLCSYLSCMITDKYHIDDIYMLDLPYSTKDGISMYKMAYCLPNVEYLKFSCIPDSKFYDIELQISTDETYESHITLGSFKTTYNSDWNELCEYQKFLTTPLKLNPILVSEDNALVNNIKLSKLNNFVTDYTLLREYFTVNTKDVVKLKDDDVAELIKQKEECYISMYNGLIALGESIGKKLYDDGNNNKLSNIMKFITIDNCGYSFYAICAIIFYFHKIHDELSIETCKQRILDILLVMVENSEHNKNESLLQIINSLKAYECMVNMSKIFENIDDWFKFLLYIAKLEKLENLDMTLNDKRVNIITLQLKIYNSQDAIILELVELCKLLIPIIKVEYGLNKFHYYVDEGLYIPISSEKFFSQNTIQIQMIESILKKMLKKLIISKQLSEEIYKTIQMKDVWLTYFNQLEVKIPNFNFYDYFISTELGVFNTLTGMYMKHTPLLYMNTKKAYCVIPSIMQDAKSLTLYELNNHILKENQNQLYSNILKVIKTEQQKLFFGSIVVPGLLKLEDALYDEAQENIMMNLIYKQVISDTNEINEKLLYFMQVLIVKYNLCIKNLIFVIEHIINNINDHGECTRTDFRRYCVAKNINCNENNLTDFVQQKNTTLYNQLSSEYGNKFIPKVFVLAIVMGSFEVAHSSNSKLDMFNWKSETVQITLSPFDLFYNYETSNLSIKSYENVKRILSYLIPNDNIPEPLINLIRTISTMLMHDEVIISDFLNIFSMIYNHNNKRKKLAILIGSPNSGKSTYQHMLSDIHGKSIYSVSSIIQAEGQGPAPEIINALSMYCFSIVELRSMTPTTMKGMISGDLTHKRLCHQNEMIALKPLSFAIAAANNLPKIYQADEAIRDRLAPFLFQSVFVDKEEIDNIIDDNPLLTYICNYLVSSTKFQIHGISREFSNILYEQYASTRDEHGLVQPKISETNENSQNLIKQTLIKNNIIYYILNQSSVIFDKSLSITYEELLEVITPELEKHNETTKNKRFTKKWAKQELSLMFKNKETPDKTGIRGLGLKINKIKEELMINDILCTCSNSNVSVSQIKSYLFHIKKLNYSNINTTLINLKQAYNTSFDSENQRFKNCKLKYE